MIRRDRDLLKSKLCGMTEMAETIPRKISEQSGECREAKAKDEEYLGESYADRARANIK